MHLPAQWLTFSKQLIPFFIGSLFILLLSLLMNESGQALDYSPGHNFPSSLTSSQYLIEENGQIYLPLVHKPGELKSHINAPYFDGEVLSSQSVVFWFGKVNPTSNYADVRVGYNDELLKISMNIFDRQLWLDSTPTKATLTDWNSEIGFPPMVFPTCLK